MWENVHFSTKPWHVTPQIDRLRKTSPALRVSTHIYGVSQEIDGKTFIFQTKPRHVTPQINCLRKRSPVLRVSPHIYGVSKDIWGKMFIFQLNLVMWPLKLIVLKKHENYFWGFQHAFMGFLKDIAGKTFIFQTKPRHVTPQINCLGKMSTTSEGFNTHLWGFSGYRWENVHF